MGVSISKYTEQFKLQLVQQYLGGHEGYRLIAKQYGVKKALVCFWVRLYKEHGLDGLCKKHTYYNAEFKLSVLQLMRRLCLSHSKVAARFNIRNIGCIGQWESSYHHGGFEALAPRVRGKPQAISMTKPAPEPTQPLLSGSIDLPGSTQLPSREDLQ